jgi:hypothetical protein
VSLFTLPLQVMTFDHISRVCASLIAQEENDWHEVVIGFGVDFVNG